VTVIARSLLVVLTAALSAACIGPVERELDDQRPALIIEGFLIRNKLPYTVTDVMIDVPATGGFAGCGNILAGSYCRSTFQPVDYRANAVVISWQERGESHRTDAFVIDVPAHLENGGAAVIEVIIFAPGQAGAQLTQSP
jgi:hypothetical protein